MPYSTPLLHVTGDALLPGTTVRYHFRTGSALATVIERTDEHVTFVGDECDGRFTHDQIDRLLATDRLQIVLDDEYHAPRTALVDTVDDSGS
jgi:hypothetical protein